MMTRFNADEKGVYDIAFSRTGSGRDVIVTAGKSVSCQYATLNNQY